MESTPVPAPVAAETNVDSPGESLAAGRYLVYGHLGQGSQAETFRAVDKQLGKAVAVKRFRVGHARAWKDVELAEREARILASLNHPALPQYFDHFEENGCLYLVMECVEGQSLAAYVKQGHRLSLLEVRQLLDTLSNVLEYLHTRVPPVIHRDIKPGNIIRRPDGTFCLVDFGSVRDGLRPEGGSTVVGTFGYMAPEQFQGRAMPATDVYAVGALLLALLTGKSPDELPHQGLGIDAQTALGGAWPAPWVEMIAQMVNINPDQRPSRLAPLLETLDQRTATSPRNNTSRPAQTNIADSDSERDPDAAFTVMVGSGFGLIPLLALTLVRIVLLVALGIVVPLVLRILSIFFGAPLRQAAAQVSAAGQQARARLADVAGHLQRAEPFVLQGRHYRRRERKRALKAARRAWKANDWRDHMEDWRAQMEDWRAHEPDWRHPTRIDVPSTSDDNNDQDEEHRRTPPRGKDR